MMNPPVPSRVSRWRFRLFIVACVLFSLTIGALSAYPYAACSLDRARALAGRLAIRTWGFYPNVDDATARRYNLGHRREAAPWIEHVETGPSSVTRSYWAGYAASWESLWALLMPPGWIHVIACLAATSMIWVFSRPRVLSDRPESPLYARRLWCWLMLSTALPAVPLLCSFMFVRYYWQSVARQGLGPTTALAIDLHDWARRGPTLGAIFLYAVLLLWAGRRLTLWMARRERVAVSAGRLDNSGRCLSCGYEAGDLIPCPECGANDPKATPPAVYLGSWHMRIAMSRWRWLIPTAVVLVALTLYALPLVVGVAKSLMF